MRGIINFLYAGNMFLYVGNVNLYCLQHNIIPEWLSETGRMMHICKSTHHIVFILKLS